MINSRRLRLLGSALMLLASAALALAETVHIPKGTQVQLQFDQPLSSKNAKVGQKVPLTVAKDVKINGSVVIKQGTQVTGVLSEVKKRQRFGVNAKIQLTLNPIETVYGATVPVTPASKGKQLKGSKTDKAALASGGGALLLGPVGLIGGLFVSGKEVKVKKGDKLVAEVSTDTKIVSN